jgi:hypothetical protein
MYYKRISDLKPLGKPNGNNWNDIIPLDLVEKYVETEIIQPIGTLGYSKTNGFEAYPLDSDVASSLKDYMHSLQIRFNSSDWSKKIDDSVNYYNVAFHERTGQHGSEQDIDYVNYLKSIWIEAIISKDSNNKPTADKNKIRKYQSKRLNLYKFLNSVNELEATRIDSDYIKVAETLNANSISTTFISTKLFGNSNTFNSGFANISSISAQQLTAKAISSNIGIIDEFGGEFIYYINARLTSLDYAGMFVVKNGTFKRGLSTPGAGGATSGHFNRMHQFNLNVVDTIESPLFHIDGPSIVEMYSSDKNYMLGRLVQFKPTVHTNGSTSVTSEITLASSEVNGVISETPSQPITNWIRGGVQLNSKVITDKDILAANDINWDGTRDQSETDLWLGRVLSYEVETTQITCTYNKPVVLAGRTKVVVTPPVKKYEKLYLRKDIPGVACSKTGLQWWRTNESALNYMERHGKTEQDIGIYGNKPIGVSLATYREPVFTGGPSHVYIPTALSQDIHDQCAVLCDSIVQLRFE